MSKNNICNNCGKQGHQFHQCKLPITSYGIILFRISSDNIIEYLMIRRKNSFGYIDFIRGKYIQNNLDHLQIMFNEMSMSEKEQIRENTFETLWKMMWGIQDSGHSSQFKGEELSSQKKFELLKNGLPIGPNGEIITIDSLINNSTTNWIETEWEFPKGRRNFQEKDLDCALREFEEETGISKKIIKIVENFGTIKNIIYLCLMSNIKEKYFDEINFSMEKTRLQKALDEVEPNDISPVYLIKKAVGKFYLSEEEITEIVKEYYKF